MTGRLRALLLVLMVTIGLVSPAVTAPVLAATRPLITQVGAGSGPLQPTKVVIRGKNLRGVKAVRFGTHTGVVVGRSGSTTVTVSTPRGMRAGTVSVRVRTAAGWSAVSTKARFTFVAAPTLARISPASGAFSGGTRVTLTGKNLSTATKVVFGSQAAKILSRKAGTLVVRAPIGVLGRVHVIVTTRGGRTQGVGITFAYVKPPAQAASALEPASGTLVATDVDWVTGGYNADTGATDPWLVGLPKGATAPTVGQQFLVRPGNTAFPSGLAGTVSEVADQLDETVRVTVQPTTLDNAVNTLSVDYSGPVTDPDAGIAARDTEIGKGFEFALKGPTALACKDGESQPVTVGADLTMSVTDVDVDYHADFGGLVRKPSFDGAFTAELKTTGKISVGTAATCKIKDAWANAHRRIIPLGDTGATLSFGPAFEFKISSKGTWSVVDRTRTTFAVNAVLGKTPTFSRTSQSVESTQSGEFSFEAEVTGGVSVQLGILDRAGLQGKVQLGISVALKETTAPNVCVEGEIFAKMAVGVFLDAWVARWERDAFTAKLSIRKLEKCLLAEEPAPTGEPEIASARLPEATIGTAYAATLATADGRDGTWTIVRFPLPGGLSLAADGSITGTPTGPVGDYPVIVSFQDDAGRVATTTIRIMVQPGQSLGGGDIQATLRWSGAADLDLHVLDPAGEEIYYHHPDAASGGHLDHDANAGCNGIEDDDNPVENIYWPTGGAPHGSYTVWVKVYNTCDAPLDWQLSVRRNGTLIVDQSGTGDSSTYSFTLGSAAAGLGSAGVRVGAQPTGPLASRGVRKR